MRKRASEEGWAYTYYRSAVRLVRAVVGFTVLAVGIALLVLPGPAFVVIPVGLAILAGEFVWARKLLHRVRDEAKRYTGGENKGGPYGDDGRDRTPPEGPRGSS